MEYLVSIDQRTFRNHSACRRNRTVAIDNEQKKRGMELLTGIKEQEKKLIVH